MRVLKWMFTVCMLFISCFYAASMIYAVSPLLWLSFETDFASPLLTANDAEEKLINLNIDQNASLEENMKKLFYPDPDAENSLWKMIRNISVGVLLIFLVWAGVKFLLFAPDSEEELKLAWKNIIYILYGAVLVFLAVWILWTALDVTQISGAVGDGTEATLVSNFENNVLIWLLSFLKWLAFFLAVIFLVWYGYRMMEAFSEEEKLKAAKEGVLNVFLALIFIKIIDYIYFIAQTKDFKNQAIEFVVQATKFLGYLWGIMFVIALVYAWYQFISAWGNDDKINKAKTVIKSVFVIILIILLFMLIIYQVFNDLL